VPETHTSSRPASVDPLELHRCCGLRSKPRSPNPRSGATFRRRRTPSFGTRARSVCSPHVSSAALRLRSPTCYGYTRTSAASTRRSSCWCGTQTTPSWAPCSASRARPKSGVTVPNPRWPTRGSVPAAGRSMRQGSCTRPVKRNRAPTDEYAWRKYEGRTDKWDASLKRSHHQRWWVALTLRWGRSAATSADAPLRDAVMNVTGAR
jgi:hypothetical protein